MGRLSKVFDTAKEYSLHQENESINALSQEDREKQMEETSSLRNNENTKARNNEIATTLDNENTKARNNEIATTLDNENTKARNNEKTKTLNNENKKTLNKELVNLNFKVDIEVRRKIKQYAAAHDQSLKEVFERAIQFYMEHNP